MKLEAYPVKPFKSNQVIRQLRQAMGPNFPIIGSAVF
jgi:hypothetical protein